MKLFYITGCLASGSTLMFANEMAQNLPPVTIKAESSDLLGSLDLSRQRIHALSGGASLVTPDDWSGRALKPEQIFQFDPGVYARSTGTSNDTRLAVRGSGIQRRFGSRGVTLLFDGMPANHADGSFYFRLFDPLAIDHVVTYRGANGLAYGGAQLGGAIEVIQKNGLSHPGTLLLTEYGSLPSNTPSETPGQRTESGRYRWQGLLPGCSDGPQQPSRSRHDRCPFW